MGTAQYPAPAGSRPSTQPPRRSRPAGRARWLAARTGLDLAAIWEWDVAGRLSSGLLCTRIHLQPLGRDTLAAAEAVAGLMIG